MPFKSRSQARFMFAAEHRGEFPKGTAKRWAEHTPDIKALPDKVEESSKEAGMLDIASLGVEAAQRPYLAKLASATGLSHGQIKHLAGIAQIPVVPFCKQAEADPEAFDALVRLVKAGAVDRNGIYIMDGTPKPKPQPLADAAIPKSMQPKAPAIEAPRPGFPQAGPQNLPTLADSHKSTMADYAKNWGVDARGKPIIKGSLGGKYADPRTADAITSAKQIYAPGGKEIAVEATKGPGLLDRLGRGYGKASYGTGNYLNKAIQALGGKGFAKGKGVHALGSYALPALGALGAGGLYAGASALGGSSPKESPAAQLSAPEPPPGMNMQQGGGGMMGGMSPTMKALLAGGGLAAGGYGLSKLFGKKKRKEVQAMDKRATLGLGAALGAPLGLMQSEEGHGAEGLVRGGFRGAGSDIGGTLGLAAGGGHDAMQAVRGKGGKLGMGALLGLLGGSAAGYLGSGALLGKPSWEVTMRKPGQGREVKAMDKSASEMAVRIMKRAVMTKLASIRQNQARTVMVHHLEKVASHLPVDRQHQVRTMQLAVSQGKPLSYAIKLAYPWLSGEKRGIMATQLVKSAVAFIKKSNAGAGCGPGGMASGMPTQQPMSQTGPVGNMGTMMGKMGL